MDDSRSPLFENLRKLINVVDELRDVGLQQYINLPRIAVLGTQSAGKSSLLEAIMGIDCLPRGDGVVTRRPLELRLVHSPHVDKPWGVFEEIKGEKFLDFDRVKDKINELTDKVCGAKSKGIVDQPIVLTVYSPSCPDLTLIDLPGITRVPLPGQDPEIERITKDMAGRYCKDPRTIILCVVSANADMSTSDGLQMARLWDPSGERTIGVITKIDIMDNEQMLRKCFWDKKLI
jgi:dynamin 1-like protein